MSNKETKKVPILRLYLWTISFLKPYKWQVLLFIVCGLVVTASEMAVPKFIQYFIDVILPVKDEASFFRILLYIVGILLLMFIAMGARNILIRIIREKAARDLQFSIFQKILELGFSYYERTSVGKTLSLLNTEIKNVQEIYRNHFPETISQSLIVIFSIIMMFFIDYRLAMLMIPCFVLYYIFNPYINKKSYKYGEESANRRIELNQKIYESISAIKEFRIFKRLDWDLDQLTQKYKTYNESQVNSILYSYIRGSFRRLTVYIGAIIVFIYGSYLVKDGTLTVGNFVAFTFYYFFMINAVTILIHYVTEQRILMFQADKLHELMSMQAEITEVENPVHIDEVKGQIDIENISFAYPNRNHTIRDVNLNIKSGEQIALVGLSGSGKTTLLKLINRFYDPSHGHVYLDGVDIKELSLEQLRESIGYVFQDTYLFSDTVANNIKFGKPHSSIEEIIASAKAANAHEFIMSMPDGYETVLGERGHQLSGGQKQRIAIARMIVKQPKIVILDEATASLDQITEKEVIDTITHSLNQSTIISISHRLSSIKNFERIIVFDNGQIVEEGNYDQLCKIEGKFYWLLNRGQSEGTDGKYAVN